jgi:hypothetical protein
VAILPAASARPAARNPAKTSPFILALCFLSASRFRRFGIPACLGIGDALAFGFDREQPIALCGFGGLYPVALRLFRCCHFVGLCLLGAGYCVRLLPLNGGSAQLNPARLPSDF